MAVQANLNSLLNAFSPITLEEMKAIRLMNRTDTKYVVTNDILMEILQATVRDYRLQEVNAERHLAYSTLYFDTFDQMFYLMHHNGRKRREKIRMRSYLVSDLTFLEIKDKNNHGRTDKAH